MNKQNLKLLNVGKDIVNSVINPSLNTSKVQIKKINKADQNNSVTSNDNLSLFKNSVTNRDKKVTSLENKTKISNISEKTDFNLKDDFEISRTNKILDKIITSVGNYRSSKTLDLDSKIGLDHIKNELILLKKLETIDKNLSTLTLTSPREENEKYELVEKNSLDTMRKENDDISKQIKNLMEQLKELKINFHKVSGETNFLKAVNESQDKLKSETTKKVLKLNNEIEEANKNNQKLKNILTAEKIEKDSMYRALIGYTKQFDYKLAGELENIYKIYNNQYFLATHKPLGEEGIEELLAKISQLEMQIISVNSEISSVNKLLLTDQNKRRNSSMKSLNNINNRNIRK